MKQTGNFQWLERIVKTSVQDQQRFKAGANALSWRWTAWSATDALQNDVLTDELSALHHNPRAIAVDLNALRAGFSELTLWAIEFIDVPEGVSFYPGVCTEPGIWQVPSTDQDQVFYLAAPGQSGTITLMVQLSGHERGSDETISMMSGIEIEIPEEKNTAENDSKPAQPEKMADKPGDTLNPPPEPAKDKQSVSKPRLKARAVPIKRPHIKSPAPQKPGLKQGPQKRTAGTSQAISFAKKPAPAEPEPKAAKPDVTPEPSIAGNQGIVVRLGAIPELGDPHYRIYIDGRQVSSGNIDYSSHPPGDKNNPEPSICWQDVTIPWDDTTDMPSKLLIRYDDDQTGPLQQPRNLVVDYVLVNGIKIDPNGPYAFYPMARRPMGGSLQRDLPMSWDGDLIFNVTGALAGNPNLVIAPPPEADHPENAPSIKPDRDRVLQIKASREDIQNPAVMAELKQVRNYLRGQDGPDPQQRKRMNTLGFLGVDQSRWSDLKVVDPGGNAVELDVPGAGLKRAKTDQDAGRLVRHRFVENLVNRAVSGMAQNKQNPEPSRKNDSVVETGIDHDQPPLASSPASVPNEKIIQEIIAKARILRQEFMDEALIASRKLHLNGLKNITNPDFSNNGMGKSVEAGNRIRKHFMTSSLQKTIKALEHSGVSKA